MGGNFDEAKIMWRPKGKRIANMSEIEVKDILNKTFYNLRRELAYEYGNNGYTGTLAEKDSANITILPFLTDSELKKLKGWIINFETIICKNKMNDEEWRKPIGSQGSYYNFDDITHAWNYYILGGQNNYWSSPKIGSYAIEKFQDKIRNCERLWKKTLEIGRASCRERV